MNKQIIKESEARIIIYLANVPNTQKNLINISQKLEIDYGYTLRILTSMNSKGWVTKHKHGRFVSYDITTKAPLKLAQQLYLLQAQQKPLETQTNIKEAEE